jgi:hypothetical protein
LAITSRYCASVLFLVTVFGSFAPPIAQKPGEQADVFIKPETTLLEIDWLAGSWSGAMWGGVFSAHYSTPKDGMILSHSKLMKDDREAFYEFEVFSVREGSLYLQPYPGGKKAGGFPLLSHDAEKQTAVFENPNKDFPTRIVYRRTSENSLEITLSDPHGSSEKIERFVLSR